MSINILALLRLSQDYYSSTGTASTILRDKERDFCHMSRLVTAQNVGPRFPKGSHRFVSAVGLDLDSGDHFPLRYLLKLVQFQANEIRANCELDTFVESLLHNK